MIRMLLLYLCLLYTVLGDLPYPYSNDCLIGKHAHELAEDDRLPRVDIDLDLAPRDRFKAVAKEHKDHIVAMIKVIKDLMRALLGSGPIQWVDANMGRWADLFPETYSEEMKGISEVTGIELGEIVFYNIFNELSSLCTAIVARTETGDLIHGRTMDFGYFMGWNVTTHDWIIPGKMRQMSVMARYFRKGELLYEAVLYPGFVGQFGAYKPGAFAITLNQRSAPAIFQGGYMGIVKWLLGMGNQFVCLKLREIMETARDYTEGIDMLGNGTTYTVPAYYVVSGLRGNEGCLITVGLNGMDSRRCLSNERWYIVQTNYDDQKDTPFWDDRRIPAEKCMDKMTQRDLSVQNIYTVLGSVPNLNKLTVYAHVMRQNAGYNEAYSTHCPNPCWWV